LFEADLGVGVWSVDLVSDASILVAGCEDGTVKLLKKSIASQKGKKK